MDWHEIFFYDHELGVLYWKKSGSNRCPPGSVAGTKKIGDYVSVNVNGMRMKAHRIIWDMFNPQDLLTDLDEIDHINHDRRDNRLINLRKVTHKINNQNYSKKRNNTSGVTGVYYDRVREKWVSRIDALERTIFLGRFSTLHEAEIARKSAEKRYGFHENHGKDLTS